MFSGGAEQEFLGPPSGKCGELSLEGDFKMAAKIQLVDVLWFMEIIILAETW